MKVIDYYIGFEGEPEIRIIQKSKDGHNIALLKLWGAYFDIIMELIEPNEEGYWEGIALPYNLATGWYDDGSWECDDVVLFLKQLDSIDENKLKESKPDRIKGVSFDVLEILKAMLKNTIDSKGRILIEYD
jgi:hypothetical protein